jgi:hypothetical protein
MPKGHKVHETVPAQGKLGKKGSISGRIQDGNSMRRASKPPGIWLGMQIVQGNYSRSAGATGLLGKLPFHPDGAVSAGHRSVDNAAKLGIEGKNDFLLLLPYFMIAVVAFYDNTGVHRAADLDFRRKVLLELLAHLENTQGTLLQEFDEFEFVLPDLVQACAFGFKLAHASVSLEYHGLDLLDLPFLGLYGIHDQVILSEGYLGLGSVLGPEGLDLRSLADPAQATDKRPPLTLEDQLAVRLHIAQQGRTLEDDVIHCQHYSLFGKGSFKGLPGSYRTALGSFDAFYYLDEAIGRDQGRFDRAADEYVAAGYHRIA